MIYDKIENAKKYLGINKNLDIALDYISLHDLQSLPDGKTVIDGDNVFVNVMTADTNENNDGVFEYHKSHFDIQIDLIGCEKVLTALDDSAESLKYTDDIGFKSAEPTACCILKPGYFTVCMANELHKPTLAVEKSQSIRKAVLKISV